MDQFICTNYSVGYHVVIGILGYNLIAIDIDYNQHGPFEGCRVTYLAGNTAIYGPPQ